jgi:hypothetical protein
MIGTFAKELGESIVKKRGRHWALTSFDIESWQETRAVSAIFYQSNSSNTVIPKALE